MRTPLITVLLVASLCACDDDDDLDDLGAFRIIHASPGAPPVDVFVDSGFGPLITGLAYGQASPYLGLIPGDYDLVLRAAGTDTILYQADLQIDRDEPITGIITGYVGSTASADGFRVITFDEDFDDISPDLARVRVVHASPDIGTVDVDVNDDGTIEVAMLERFGDSGEAGLEVPTNVPLQIGIDVAGTPGTAFTTPALPGQDLFVIVFGNAGDLPRAPTGLELLVVGPDGVIATVLQNPTLYALHASPDAGPVDIRNGDTGPILIGDLAFGELGATQVPPGDYLLTFFPAGVPDAPPIDGTTVTVLTAGQRYLAVATGMVTPVGTEQPFQLAIYTEEFATDGAPRIRAIHASPDAPVIDISTATGNVLNAPPLFSDLQFLEASSGEGLLVGSSPSLHMGIAPTRSLNAVETFDLDTAVIGRAFLVAAGALTPAAGEERFRMFVIDTVTSPWSFATVTTTP